MGLVMWAYAAVFKLIYKPTRPEWPKFLLAGFMSTGLYMVLFLEGMNRVGAAQGAVCLATAPIWVSILAVIIGQEPKRWQLFVGGSMAYAGVATVILLGSGERHWTITGLLLTLGSALIWSISVVMMKPLLSKGSAVGVYVATYPGAALILFPYAFVQTLQFNYSHVSWIGWSGLAYLTIVAGFAAFTSYYVGVRDVGGPKASMTAYFVPVVAAVSEWVVQGTRLNIFQILGIGIVLFGVWFASIKPKSFGDCRALQSVDEIA